MNSCDAQIPCTLEKLQCEDARLSVAQCKHWPCLLSVGVNLSWSTWRAIEVLTLEHKNCVGQLLIILKPWNKKIWKWALFYTKPFPLQFSTQLKKQEDGSAGKGICCCVWQLQFDPWDLQCGRGEPTLASCPLTSRYTLWLADTLIS